MTSLTIRRNNRTIDAVGTALAHTLGVAHRIVDLPIGSVERSPFNPAERTEVENLEKLTRSIQENGQLDPIKVVEFPGGIYKIADGNRRREAKSILGDFTVTCLVYTPNEPTEAAAAELLNKLFANLNVATRAFGGKDQLNACLQGAPGFTSGTRSVVAQLLALFPEQEYQEMLINKGMTPTQFRIAKKSTEYVLEGSGISEGTPTYQARIKKHLFYLMRHPMQQPMTAYVRLGYDRKALKNAIDNDRPVPHTSSQRVVEGWNKVQ